MTIRERNHTMATRTDTTPSAADFDQWDDDKEEQALKDAADSCKVRHIIKNGEYWALVPGGRVYKLPLFLSITDFEKLSEAGDVESIGQFKRIMAAFAGDEQARQLEAEPLQVAFNLLKDYGEILARTQGVDDLGKSAPSAA